MERKTPKPMTPFDNMVTPPSLYTLKLLLPYTPSSNQRSLGIYIKFMELQYTMEHFYGFSFQKNRKTSGPASATFSVFEDLKPYMAKEEMEMMEQMEMMMNMMEMVQGMQTAEGGGGASGGFNPMDMMMGMLSPDQQNMFQMYNSMFDADLNQMSAPVPDTDSEASECSGEPDNPRKYNNQKGDYDYEYEPVDEPSCHEEYRPGKA